MDRMDTHPAGMARAMHSGISHAEATPMTADKFILVADDDEPSREGLKLLSMVQVEIARQEGQTTMRFECPACGHTLTDPVGASSSPSGW